MACRAVVGFDILHGGSRLSTCARWQPMGCSFAVGDVGGVIRTGN